MASTPSLPRGMCAPSIAIRRAISAPRMATHAVLTSARRALRTRSDKRHLLLLSVAAAALITLQLMPSTRLALRRRRYNIYSSGAAGLPYPDWCPNCAATSAEPELCNQQMLFVVSTVGFKEIQWTPLDVEIIRRIAPCSRFIFNFRRSIADQAQSSWFRHKQNSVSKLTQRTAELRDFRAQMEKKCHNTYEMMKEDFSPDNFTRLARWLGASCSFSKMPHNNEVALEVGEAVQCV